MADKIIDNARVAPGRTIVFGQASGTSNLFLSATVTAQGTIESAEVEPNVNIGSGGRRTTPGHSRRSV